MPKRGLDRVDEPSPELARTLRNCAVHARSDRQGAGRLRLRRRRRGGDDRARRRQPRGRTGAPRSTRGAGEGLARALDHPPSCPLQKARPRPPERAREHRAHEWKRDVFAWFARPSRGARPCSSPGCPADPASSRAGGRSRFETSVERLRGRLGGPPATVRRIVVIRDTPRGGGDTGRLRRPRPAPHGGAPGAPARCRAARRSTATRRGRRRRMPRAASRRSTSRRSSATRPCYPVIGGALVLRDRNHMTGRLLHVARAVPAARGRPAHGVGDRERERSAACV